MLLSPFLAFVSVRGSKNLFLSSFAGKVLLSTPRLLGGPYRFKILSVSPVAAAISSRVNFTVKVLNLAYSSGRYRSSLHMAKTS